MRILFSQLQKIYKFLLTYGNKEDNITFIVDNYLGGTKRIRFHRINENHLWEIAESNIIIALDDDERESNSS